jgi:hypothetical protein
MVERRNYPHRAIVSCRVVRWLLTGDADVVEVIDQGAVQRILKRMARRGLVKAHGRGWAPTAVFRHPATLIEMEGIGLHSIMG